MSGLDPVNGGVTTQVRERMGLLRCAVADGNARVAKGQPVCIPQKTIFHASFQHIPMIKVILTLLDDPHIFLHL
jgi:hypothetical protein